MPEAVSLFESVQLADGFMVVGGYELDTGHSAFVTQTIDSNYTWRANMEGLTNSRAYTAAVTVPDDFLSC